MLQEKIHRHRHQPSHISIGGPKRGQFCSNFRPHAHFKRSGFKTKQRIESLKNAQYAQMIGLKSRQGSYHIPPAIFTSGHKNNFAQFYHFMAVAAISSEWWGTAVWGQSPWSGGQGGLAP